MIPTTDNETREKSEFNQAVSYLNRLNSLFYMADDNAIRLDIYGWFHTLLALYRELSTEMKPREHEWFNSQIPEFLIYFSDMHERIKNDQGVMIDYNIYKRLNDFEVELRRIQKDAGLLLRLSGDRSFGVGSV